MIKYACDVCEQPIKPDGMVWKFFYRRRIVGHIISSGLVFMANDIYLCDDCWEIVKKAVKIRKESK